MALWKLVLHHGKPNRRSSIENLLKHVSVRYAHFDPADPHFAYPRLTKAQVTKILQGNERVMKINHEAISRFESSRLAANTPIEDRNSEGYCNATDGYLFGIFDGHAGVANAQAVSERIFNYIAINLLNASEIKQFYHSMEDSNNELKLVNFLTHNATYFNSENRDLYRDAILNYTKDAISSISDWDSNFTMEKALQSAFLRLDKDLEDEAFRPVDGKLNTQLLTIALSGCCALIAHIDGPHLHVANLGDCGAVLGTRNEDGTWQAKSLANAHHVDNEAEKSRLREAHLNETGSLMKDGRLLGVIEPTRTFGDFRLKLPAKLLKDTEAAVRSLRLHEEEVGPFPSYYMPPKNYYTPPYLIAKPEVLYHHLRPKDKFLVLATDGLWNMFKDREDRVIQLVADHMDGAQTIEDFELPKDRSMQLKELNERLKIRKQNIAKRAEDLNCATHLIRNALGGTPDQGLSHLQLSAMLSHPNPRLYRDDITVTVIYFDEEYLTGNLSIT